ncbi:MAG: hypothetical protein Ta2C_00760 [Candidatus Endomicrobiellum trichonymphae]|nr:MAG: hypothetical protein Ta2C_00760 [Candidatus Endomicrobium trichonymphae]
MKLVIRPFRRTCFLLGLITVGEVKCNVLNAARLIKTEKAIYFDSDKIMFAEVIKTGKEKGTKDKCFSLHVPSIKLKTKFF